MNTAFTRATLALSAAALALTCLAAPAFAQRDPAYEAARSSGKVGEKPEIEVPGGSLVDLLHSTGRLDKLWVSERAG